MAASRLAFGLDEEGDEVLEMHSAAGEPTRGPNNKVVMMRWEQPYMEALVEALELQATDEVSGRIDAGRQARGMAAHAR